MPAVAAAVTSINEFSISSYYVSLAGSLERCSSSYSACNWTGDVGIENARIQAATGAHAQPLVFSNSGDMVKAFRALTARPNGISAAAQYLGSEASTFGYRRVQLDLEPSCWARNASDCAWPRPEDALNYVRFVNATADALAAVGAKVSLAVGTWPEGQCSRANYSACAAAPDTWASECERGAWAVDVCNCCAYAFPFGFFALPDLCGSRAATIVNMDTYQHSPANLTAFDAALAFYLSHGCTSERLAIGLLADEALDASEAAALIDRAIRSGAAEVRSPSLAFDSASPFG